MPAPVFHRLTVSDVTAETDDSVAVTFAVPEALIGEFAYLPGQHVTLRAVVDGEDVRRSYSICADASTGVLRVGIKQLPGGAFSTWATTSLRPGAALDVMPPVGEFTITPDPNRSLHYAAIAAGSGITPVLSLVSTVLSVEPESRFTVVYGNRRAASIMFLDELEGLKNRYPGRLHLVHVLSREGGIVPLLSGRLDAGKLAELLDTVVDAGTVDEWFLCGPYEMVTAAHALLQERGFGDDAVHDELFFAGPIDPALLPPLQTMSPAPSSCPSCSRGGGRPCACFPRPRCSMPPSRCGASSRIRARAGCAPVARPGWSTARWRWTRTTP